MSRFLSWYGNRKRKAMANDATLSFRQFLVKIGLLFVFILVDLIFFPSVIQIFLQISMDFFIAWAVGGLILVLAEKYLLEKNPDSANFHPKLQQNFRRKNLALISQIWLGSYRMKITAQEIEDIAIGAAVLGTGGGGNPFIGKLLSFGCGGKVWSRGINSTGRSYGRRIGGTRGGHRRSHCHSRENSQRGRRAYRSPPSGRKSITRRQLRSRPSNREDLIRKFRSLWLQRPGFP